MTSHQIPSPESRVFQSVRRLFHTGHLPLVIFHLSFFILLIPAIQPLLTADLTCGYDNTFHLWRAVETESLLRRGVLFSRWAPNMAQGYGYPLFNFAAPASPYGVVLFRLLGLPWPWALNLTFAVGWVLSAYTMYLFVSDVLGRYAGMVAAILYTYAPFHAYDVFYRGGLSQSSAWFIPPLILWALRRADTRAGFAVTALGCTALVLTHNAFALLFTPLLLVYAFVVGCQRGRRVALRGGVALLVGLGLSTFFWLPALDELRFVHNERLSGAWVFEYANNYLPVERLLAPPRTADPFLINDWPARGLGLVPTLLAVVGLSIALRNRQYRVLVVVFATASVLCLFLVLPISGPVWDALPLLQRVQFPWRLVGPATLCAAVLAGAILSTNQSASRPTLITVVLILLLALAVLGNLGWFYPRHCPPPQDISTAGMLAWERATDTLGTTAKGEYLPVWVHRMPNDPAFEATHTATESIVRLRLESLPEGARVIHADDSLTDATIELETPASFQAHYLSFYYPGWRVTIDDASVPIAPTEPDGLISFNVPAGRHTIRIHFGETGFRIAADIISLVSLAALAAILLISRPHYTSRTAHHVPRLTLHISSYCLLPTALLLLVVKLIPISGVDTPLHRSSLQGDRLRNVDVPTEITFGPEFVFLGHDALPQTVPGGGQIQVKTYWRALQPGGPDYGITVNIVDVQGHRWNGSDIRPSRWHRTPPPVWEWLPDQYATVALVVPLLPGTPPGTYTVEAVAFDRETLAPLTAYDVNGHALGPALPLGQINVVPPSHPGDPDALGIRHRLDSALGPLTLLGADFDRDQAAPGDPILLTAFWYVEQQPPAFSNLTIHLTLLAPDGSSAAEFDLPPTVSWHPTSIWKPGEIWRGQHVLYLPATLGNGDYTWHLTVEPIRRSSHIPSSIHITAPDRTFALPTVDLETEARLGTVATLVGANLEPETWDLRPGTYLTVTLVWRAEHETRTSYHVFLHMLDSEGRLIAQSDGVPAAWTRPTTGWLPGEYITDAHTLTIPPHTLGGEYALFAGLYIPDGERLTTPDGTDAVSLTTIVMKAQ